MPSMSDFPPAGNLPSGNSCHQKQLWLHCFHLYIFVLSKNWLQYKYFS